MMIASHSASGRGSISERAATLPTQVALIDQEGNVVAVHGGLTTAGKNTSIVEDLERGVNYVSAWRRANGPAETVRRAATGIQEILNGTSPFFVMDHACDTAGGMRRFRMTVTPFAHAGARAVVTQTDISDLQRPKEDDFGRLQEFARRLIVAQEEERQRIAREIHDDLGNRMAMLSLAVHQNIQPASGDAAGHNDAVSEILDRLVDLSRSLRSLSHGLHPPALRYLGLGGALRSLQEEFEKMYGMRVELALTSGLPRASHEIELCIFRVAQECLQNAAKHAAAECVNVVLEHTANEFRLTVSDSGRGFNPSEVSACRGLGLQSMRERALAVRGRLTINSVRGGGTKIQLTVPLRRESTRVRVQ